jgi:hypothetical protein
MARASEAGDRHLSATSGDPDRETSDLIAHIRELTMDDPQAVQQVVAEVLAALDRATGGAFHDRLPDEPPPVGGGYGEPPVRLADLETRAAEQQPGDTAPDGRRTSPT